MNMNNVQMVYDTSVAIMNEKYYYYNEFDKFYYLHYWYMNDKSELLATLFSVSEFFFHYGNYIDFCGAGFEY